MVLTREDTAAGRVAGRLTAAELAPLVVDPATYFVCGSAGFAESASGLLTGLGVPPGRSGWSASVRAAEVAGGQGVSPNR